MECNRDEAIRAKEIAEKKMLNNDFEGARKIALKARQLFPELENISQLIAVCDVHCSAERKIYGAEKDLYGILQVEIRADEATIRKQYRKFALVLHPDKNKFPGAEAAFKLIGEANMILSDRGKRSLYDIKYREPAIPSLSKPENRPGNQNPNFKTQFEAQNKFTNVPNSHFSGMHNRQQSQSNSSSRPSFWTYCPFCHIKYEYYRDYVNRPLRCQHCSKLFIAHDIGALGVPPGAAPGPHFVHEGMQSAKLGSNRTQPTFSQQKEVKRQGKVKVDAQKFGQFPSHFAHQTSSGTGVQSSHRSRTEDTEGGCLRTTMKKDGQINTEHRKEGITVPKVHAEKPREARVSKDKKRKRGRKMVVESSESSSDMKDTFEGIGGNSAAGKDSVSDNSHPRRSYRERQHVSYSEDAADDLSSPKRSRLRKLSSDPKDMQKEEVSGCQVKFRNSAGVPAAEDVDKKVFQQKASAHVDRSRTDAKIKEKHKSKEAVRSNSGSESDSEPTLIDCLEPEFSNFDKVKEQNCFAVGQIWACYDPMDGMPRFYAHVRRVYSSDFRLRFTWLEAEPENHLEIEWAEKELPVACGKFVYGKTQETRDCLMFSHQMIYEKGMTKQPYFIYPRKGEIWALFKGWDIKWSSETEKDRKYKFDIVEVLSDYDDGVLVTYLVKVKGFVSVFQRTIWAGCAGHRIPASDLFSFSHRIPSVKLTGTERAGVPTGSFELDTASLPDDLEEYHYSNEVHMQPECVTAQGADSCPQLHEEKVEPTTGSVVTPKKFVNSEVKSVIDTDTLKLRKSRRGSKGGDENRDEVKTDPCHVEEGGLKLSNGVKDEANHSLPTKDNNPFCQDGDVKTSPKSLTKSSKISSSSPGARKPGIIVHDFNVDKQKREFQVGQIWALYRSKDGIRECYARVKHVESHPLRLHVHLLESCSLHSRDVMKPDACGIFKVPTGGTKIFPPDSFSHIVRAEVNGKNRYNIYPREHEIWALYKKQDAESAYSDLDGGEYDIVEVLESSEHGIKVVFLLRVPGYKSVYRAPRIQRSTERILVIPRTELNRFSHQVPAFLFTENDRRGSWELDPEAVPGLSLLGPKRG